MSDSALTARERRARVSAWAWLSVAAALATIALKALAYSLTGSVGLLSDAAESLVNLAAAGLAVAMLRLAARPPDEEHAYGYGKAEYFASGFEGALILLAAITIGAAALERWRHPRPLEHLGLGVALTALATLLNWGVARALVRTGLRHGSIALEADGRHLLTDVWTSLGVLAGLLAVRATGQLWLDPAIALGVAANILATGVRLFLRSARGLLDQGLPRSERDAVLRTLAAFEARGVRMHELRTRRAGPDAFIDVHVLVPGAWTVQRGHELLEEIEAALRRAVPGAAVLTHLEPIEDARSYADGASPLEAPTGGDAQGRS